MKESDGNNALQRVWHYDKSNGKTAITNNCNRMTNCCGLNQRFQQNAFCGVKTRWKMSRFEQDKKTLHFIVVWFVDLYTRWQHKFGSWVSKSYKSHTWALFNLTKSDHNCSFYNKLNWMQQKVKIQKSIFSVCTILNLRVKLKLGIMNFEFSSKALHFFRKIFFTEIAHWKFASEVNMQWYDRIIGLEVWQRRDSCQLHFCLHLFQTMRPRMIHASGPKLYYTLHHQYFKENLWMNEWMILPHFALTNNERNK